MNSRFQSSVITAIGSVFMTVALILAGYFVCIGMDSALRNTAMATISDEDSPFTKTQLTDGALATKEYSFGDHDLEKYMGVISEMNREAQTPYAESSVEELLQAPVQYSVNQEAIDHLDDVSALAARLYVPMIAFIFMAAFLLLVASKWYGAAIGGRICLVSGIAALVILAALAIWATVSFQSLFTAFHSIFFADQSWVFPADSLLITMLPEGFWSGMAMLWGGSSATLSLAAIIVGAALLRRESRSRKQEARPISLANESE